MLSKARTQAGLWSRTDCRQSANMRTCWPTLCSSVFRRHRVSGLPARNVVIAAAATPVRADYRPDGELLLARCRDLLAEGCDGIALFGTTGEGVAFTVADRREILERVIAGGLDPGRLIVSVGDLSLPDVIELAAHATRLGVAGVLLMPPCL